MHILIVGDWQWPQYEQAFSAGLEANNVKVSKLRVSDHFPALLMRVERALPLPGPGMLGLNETIVRQASNIRPDFVLFWRPTHVLPSTLRRLADAGLKTVSYNNDNPFDRPDWAFVPIHYHLLWHWYTRCLPHFSKNFFYRQSNCESALRLGAQHADMLLPYFVPSRDRPVDLIGKDQDEFKSDVAFIGHFEPDGRADSVRRLIESGIHVRIWGGDEWSKNLSRAVLERIGPIRPAHGEDYAKALCGANVCLAFLSKLNRDTYTRRCFEIPACGRAMLAERTADLLRFFREDEEACFFSSDVELVEKACWLLKDHNARIRIAAAGMKRVWDDEHDVVSRARRFISLLSD